MPNKTERSLQTEFMQHQIEKYEYIVQWIGVLMVTQLHFNAGTQKLVEL